MTKHLPEKIQRELDELRLIADHDIDFSDATEVANWDAGLRGLWSGVEYQTLNYDVRAIANEILKRAWDAGARPTNMWLNKVAWFVYERMLVDFGKLITQARVEAWDHGPVFREIYGPAKIYQSEPIADLLTSFSISKRGMDVAVSKLDAQTIKVIDDAVNSFSAKSASQLRNISHIEGSPWYRVWYSGQKTSAGMVIGPNVILAAAEKSRKQSG
ncbi:type II toxin-antitoxin system antitoxin SocA domain-containing protein [uncultured Sphingomonas sp.]|uniref:Panacea domain-containing protein n=1 Tax=uncultured Sphingomonas sp. TaxID=158754 RepID=UPI0025EAE683|nr:type II toxin-antitoxin system antitoxin SocA domain-containing protein [uncultured Sphingomonas sp.]